MGETRGHAGKNGVRHAMASRSPAAQSPTGPCSPTPGPRSLGPQPLTPGPRSLGPQPPAPDPRLPCPFCDLTGRELVAENPLAVAFLDGFPVNPGHTLIVPRRHVATWFDATREEQLAILELADRVKAQLDAQGVPIADRGASSAAKPQPLTPDPCIAGPQSLIPSPCSAGPCIPDGYNLGLNCGEAAGQTVMHLHLHVIPRYLGDHPSPKGGVRWIFPKKAKYWDE